MTEVLENRQKYQFISNFKWLQRNSEGQKGFLSVYLPLSIFIGVIANFLGLSLPSLIIFLFDKQITMGKSFGIIILLGFVLGVLVWLSNLSAIKIFWESIKVRMHLQVVDGRGFINLPYIKLIDTKVQRMRAQSAVYGYKNDDSGVGTFIPTLVILCQNVIMLVIGSVLSVFIAWWSPVLVIVTSGVIFKTLDYFSVQRTKIQKDMGQIYLEQDYLYRKSLDISMAQEIRLYFLQNKFNAKLEECQNEIILLKKRLALNSFKAKTMVLALNVGRSVPIYLFLAFKTMHGEISLVNFSFLFTFLGMLDVYIKTSSDNLEKLLNASSDITKCREYLDKVELITAGNNDKFDRNLLKNSNNDNLTIELKNVSVKYPGQAEASLKNVNLIIKPGEHLAIVGLNGAGKTTLVLTIMGIIQPDSGEILVNGTLLTKEWLTKYQTLFAPAFQENVLLADTLRNNVVISEDINEEWFANVMKNSNLDQMAKKFPKGVLTFLTRYLHDNGIMPSGGELQKIILARALYRNSPFIILDEPTAALDPLAESKLYQQMEMLFRGKTSLFISHRLSSTKFADKILFLNSGEIIASGTHTTLLNECEEYQKIFNVQKRYYESGEKE